ncbi:MAG: 50S ribosomal protein L22 [Bacteroidetes bacterium HGW-Bacteroidetes-1]|jgi:large subunit ribosomal protein L22|nr:MAG: 50S ribosomal protein L22 [Bacteroidetes bacterium HGW-Bacteroidetes-1]
MGARKHQRAEERKEARKSQFIAALRNVPTSPRKMRLVADMIRGKNVEIALYALQYSPKEASNRLYKLLRSAIANWEAKNEGVKVDYSTLFVKDVFVDSGTMLKRVLPAPQGRAHRIRKRSNHVTMILDSRVNKEVK